MLVAAAGTVVVQYFQTVAGAAEVVVPVEDASGWLVMATDVDEGFVAAADFGTAGVVLDVADSFAAEKSSD